MKATYPKRLQKEIKKLARGAHDREMRYYLELLNQKFSEWKNGKLDTWDLVQYIHEFHNGQARNLYSAYQNLSLDSFLIRAVAAGHVIENELPEEFREEAFRRAEVLKGQL